jgi:glycosyltransferase involved in cell wall biosynthesis
MRVAVVGQIPPPIHGQALMLEALVRADLRHAEILHVRTTFSTDIRDVGRVGVGKVLHVLPVLARIIHARLRGATVLYFPPSGPARLAFWRDAALLIGARWLFPRTVFHFHAAGLSELAERLSALERLLLQLAFAGPDLAILTSARNPRDDLLVRAIRTAVVPCGIEDVAPRFARLPRGPAPVLLFVGVLQESKGVRVLLEAAKLLAERGRELEVVCVGQWKSEAFRRAMEELVAGSALAQRVRFPGVLAGETKWVEYAGADIFCFPSFYEAESFGLVVLEAMSFSLPVVASRWRGLPDLVQEGETGFLVPTRDTFALADRIALLLDDPVLRARLGAAGRARFLERFTLGHHLRALDRLFEQLASEEAQP